jgi:hypothetical protein
VIECYGVRRCLSDEAIRRVAYLNPEYRVTMQIRELRLLNRRN